jgi:hypothetical protein
MTDSLFQSLASVEDEASFLLFVEQLRTDRANSENEPLTLDGFQGKWANQTIAEFLEAATAWAEDSGFGARPGPKPLNPWQQFAHFLLAGRIYE